MLILALASKHGFLVIWGGGGGGYYIKMEKLERLQ